MGIAGASGDEISRRCPTTLRQYKYGYGHGYGPGFPISAKFEAGPMYELFNFK